MAMAHSIPSMNQLLIDHRRSFNLAGFLACVAFLAIAGYLQFVEGMEPCPLCIFQRVVFAVLALVLLAAGLHAPRGRAARVYGVLSLVTAAAGLALAWRHVWLQSLPPDQVPACGPGLGYMLDAFPLWDALRMVLSGSGECAEVDRFLGVSIAWWTLWTFLFGGIAAAVVNWPARRAR